MEMLHFSGMITFSVVKMSKDSGVDSILTKYVGDLACGPEMENALQIICLLPPHEAAPARLLLLLLRA